MAAVDDATAHALREELADLQVALERKRSEISNLKLGYIRSVEGGGFIPPEPLRRNLVTARAELVDLERQIAGIEARLDDLDPAPSPLK